MDLRFCSPSEAAAGFAARSQTLTALAETHHDRKSGAFDFCPTRGQRISCREKCKVVEASAPQARWTRPSQLRRVPLLPQAIARLFAIKRLNNRQFGA
jgi:hypothetical protein